MSGPVWLALAVVALFGVVGWREGVVKRLLEIGGVVLTLILTARFATAVQPWVLTQTGVDERASLLLTWAGLFLLGALLSRLIAGLLSKLVRLTLLGWVDRFGGAVVGMAFGALLASVLLVAASAVPGGDTIQKTCQESGLGRALYYAAPRVYEGVRGWGGEDLDAIWQRSLDFARDGADQARQHVQDELQEKAGAALER